MQPMKPITVLDISSIVLKSPVKKGDHDEGKRVSKEYLSESGMDSKS
jgi:hypothetical protein